MRKLLICKISVKSASRKDAVLNTIQAQNACLSMDPRKGSIAVCDGANVLAAVLDPAKESAATVNAAWQTAVDCNLIAAADTIAGPADIAADITAWKPVAAALGSFTSMLVVIDDTRQAAGSYDGLPINGENEEDRVFDQAEVPLIIDRLRWLAENMPSSMSAAERRAIEKDVIEHIRLSKRFGYAVTEFKPRFQDCGKKYIWRAVSGLGDGDNLIFVGEKGTGKNVLASDLASLFNLPEVRIELPNMTREDLEISAAIDNATSRYELSDFLKAVKAGSLVVLDEMNMIRNDASLAFLNSLMEPKGQVDVSHYGTLTKHPLTLFIATQNPVGPSYGGARELNSASGDRIQSIRIDYENGSVAKILEKQVPGLTAEAAGRFEKFFEQLRALVADGTVSDRCLSMRCLIRCANKVAKGKIATVRASLEAGYFDACPEEDAVLAMSVLAAVA